jgi:hypothetical protein
MQIEERDYSEAKLRALAVIKDAVNDAFESRLWGAVAEIIYDDPRVQELLAEDPAVMRFLIITVIECKRFSMKLCPMFEQLKFNFGDVVRSENEREPRPSYGAALLHGYGEVWRLGRRRR